MDDKTSTDNMATQRQPTLESGKSNQKNTSKYKQKQTEILAMAAHKFNEKGLKDTTIAELAAGVGMSFANLTYYFKRKDDLALECYRYAFKELEQIVNQAQREASNAYERLRVFIELYFSFQQKIKEEKVNPLLDFGYIVALNGMQRDEVNQSYLNYFRSVRELIRPADFDRSNRLRLNVHTFYLMAQMNWFGYWLGGNPVRDYARLANKLFDILAQGIGFEGFEWSAPETRTYNALSKSKQIFLKAATELINVNGYRGASVEKISARLGRTKGSFYHHYKNKDELVSACYERTFAIVDEILDRIQEAKNNCDRLNHAISNLVRFQLDPSGPLLHTSGLFALSSEKRSQFEDLFQLLSDDLTSLVVDGIIDGSVRPVDPNIAALALIPTVFSASELTVWFPDYTNQQNATELFVQPFFKGILRY